MVNNFAWTTDQPAGSRRREQYIIRTRPSLTAADAPANNKIDVFQLSTSREIISNVVLQTNREARHRVRQWKDSPPTDPLQEWSEVTDGERLTSSTIIYL